MRNVDNKKSPPMINSWYLMGTKQKISECGNDGSFPMFLDELGIAARIQSITYVKQSKHLYFVAPEFPNKISCCSIGPYLLELQTESNYFEEDQAIKNFTKIFNGEIIALTSSSSHLFILTKDIGRSRSDNSYMLYRQDVDKDIGFGIVKTKSIIDLTDLLFNPDKPISISVTERRLGGGYRIYFYGEALNSTIIFANYSSQASIKPKVLKLKKVFGEIPQIDFVHSLNKAKSIDFKSQNPATLLAVDAKRNNIYIITHYKDSELKISLIGKVGNKNNIIKVTAISNLRLSVKNQGINCSDNEVNNMVLFADKVNNSIYSLSLEKPKIIHQVIGGGERDIEGNQCIYRNFLSYKISNSIDEIMAIENFGFIAGLKYSQNWFALLLPSALKSKEKSLSCEINKQYINFDNAFDS